MAFSRLGWKFDMLIEHVFQMMFVSGETADVAPETTSMIEFIVQQQVMEMVCFLATTNLRMHSNKANSSSLAQPYWQHAVASEQSAQMTSYSSSGTTAQKSADFVHSFPGKMSEKAPKTVMTRVAQMPLQTTST